MISGGIATRRWLCGRAARRARTHVGHRAERAACESERHRRINARPEPRALLATKALSAHRATRRSPRRGRGTCRTRTRGRTPRPWRARRACRWSCPSRDGERAHDAARSHAAERRERRVGADRRDELGSNAAPRSRPARTRAPSPAARRRRPRARRGRAARPRDHAVVHARGARAAPLERGIAQALDEERAHRGRQRVLRAERVRHVGRLVAVEHAHLAERAPRSSGAATGTRASSARARRAPSAPPSRSRTAAPRARAASRPARAPSTPRRGSEGVHRVDGLIASQSSSRRRAARPRRTRGRLHRRREQARRGARARGRRAQRVDEPRAEVGAELRWTQKAYAGRRLVACGSSTVPRFTPRCR